MIAVDGVGYAGSPYFPGMAAATGASLPLVSQDYINSHSQLLTQMQMLSFYHTQLYQQKKLLMDNENRERIQVGIFTFFSLGSWHFCVWLDMKLTLMRHVACVEVTTTLCCSGFSKNTNRQKLLKCE